MSYNIYDYKLYKLVHKLIIDDMFAGQFSIFIFITTVSSLCLPLIFCVIVVILQHLRFRRLKLQIGQISINRHFVLKL